MCLLHLLDPPIRPASAPTFSVEEIRDYYVSSDPEKVQVDYAQTGSSTEECSGRSFLNRAIWASM